MLQESPDLSPQTRSLYGKLARVCFVLCSRFVSEFHIENVIPVYVAQLKVVSLCIIYIICRIFVSWNFARFTLVILE